MMHCSMELWVINLYKSDHVFHNHAWSCKLPSILYVLWRVDVFSVCVYVKYWYYIFKESKHTGACTMVIRTCALGTDYWTVEFFSILRKYTNMILYLRSQIFDGLLLRTLYEAPIAGWIHVKIISLHCRYFYGSCQRVVYVKEIFLRNYIAVQTKIFKISYIYNPNSFVQIKYQMGIILLYRNRCHKCSYCTVYYYLFISNCY